MNLIKYDRSNATETSSLVASGSSSTETSSSTDLPGSRSLWGADDEFDDLDGSMTVHGNIHIMECEPTNYDPDDEGDDGEDIEEETGGGNLEVEHSITAETTEADQTYGKQLFLNYPDANGTKTDVAPLLKSHADTLANHETRITNNTTNITNLTTRVGNNETKITNLTNRVTNCETNISSNATEITNIYNILNGSDGNGGVAADLTAINNTLADHETRITALENADLSELYDLINYGNYSHPIVLFAGRVRRSSVSSSKYYFVEGNTNPNLYISGGEPKDGMLTLGITAYNGVTVNVRAVIANQENSGDMPNDPTVTSVKGRSDGAHWMIGQVDSYSCTTKIYLRNAAQRDQNNDSWGSTGWNDEGGISSANVAIFGYLDKPSTYSLRAASAEMTDDEREAWERKNFGSAASDTNTTEDTTNTTNENQ